MDMVGWMALFTETVKKARGTANKKRFEQYLSTKWSARQSKCLSSELRVIHGRNCGCHTLNGLHQPSHLEAWLTRPVRHSRKL